MTETTRRLRGQSPGPGRPSRRTLWLVIAGVAVLAVLAAVLVVVWPGGGERQGGTPGPSSAAPTTSAGEESSAATRHGWGEPNRVDEFDGPRSSNWVIYDGPGHNGNGRRTPDAISVSDGILTITGDSEGNTGGLSWMPGQKYGRWEGRMRAPASDPTYNALMLLWPDAENWPEGGEVDFVEMTDPSRQVVEYFLHYGEDNSQDKGEVRVDATEWHNWAVEWTEDHIIVYLDGNEWWRTEETWKLPPDKMHLTIQLDWFPGNGDGGDVRESSMQVDWVKQYPL